MKTSLSDERLLELWQAARDRPAIWTSRDRLDVGLAFEELTRRRADDAAQRRAGREEAAAWHDQRRRDTPDAFEMEFHEVSAKAIRSMPDCGEMNSATAIAALGDPA